MHPLFRYLGLGLWWLVRNLILAPLHWIVRELFGQAKAGTKKVLRPFLWPAAGCLVFLFLMNTMDQQTFGLLVRQFLALGAVGLGIWIMLKAALPKKKKKKKS